MKKTDVKKIGFWAAIGVFVCAIIAIIAGGGSKKNAETESAAQTSQEPIIRYVTQTETVYVDKLVPVEVEKEITTDIMEERLQEIGELITEEYLFTEVTTFESTKSYVWVIKANSKLVMGYDGRLLAGIDFTKIDIVKNDTAKTITVYLPEAKIMACELDLESFKVYEEDVSRWNPIKAEDYNGSLQELERSARDRALNRGVLDKASENAQHLIGGMIRSLINDPDYKITYVVRPEAGK